MSSAVSLQSATAAVPDNWPTAWLSAAVWTAGETIVVADLDGTIVFVNPAFERITGYTAQEAIGQNPRILASGLHDEDFYGQMWRTLTRGEPWQGRLLNRRKNGSLYEEDAVITPVRDEAGDIFCYVAVKRDFSEESRLREDLAHTRKVESLGRLAAGIAHQINTPLQYLVDNLRFLDDAFNKLRKVVDLAAAQAEKEPAGEMKQLLSSLDIDFLASECPEAFEQSHRGLEKVAEIIRAMGQFSHPGAEGLVLLDLNATIRSMLSVYGNEWNQIADVETDLEDSLPGVTCHPGDINHVLLSLMLNAADAIREARGEQGSGKGGIHVSTRQDGEWVELRVRDDGMGIPPSLHDQVFEPFFSRKQTQVISSLGQGLTVARRTIVDVHGGEIAFETEQGKGTTFIVRLPIEPRAEVAASVASQPNPQLGEKTNV